MANNMFPHVDRNDILCEVSNFGSPLQLTISGFSVPWLLENARGDEAEFSHYDINSLIPARAGRSINNVPRRIQHFGMRLLSGKIENSEFLRAIQNFLDSRNWKTGKKFILAFHKHLGKYVHVWLSKSKDLYNDNLKN